jgi:DNA-binding GntR family transcriptional regulator
MRRRIVLNEWKPGTVLTELSLAAELASSQASIREALLRLEGEGMVARSGRQGTAVTNLDAATATEILGLRRRIEGRAAKSVLRLRSQANIAGLHASLAEMHAAAADDDIWAMVRADMNFHMAMFEIAGLHAMQPILLRCLLHTHRFRLWAPWHRRSLADTANRHLPILAALEGESPALLRREIEQHLDTIVDPRSQA